MWASSVLYNGLVKQAQPWIKIPVGEEFLELDYGYSFHLIWIFGMLLDITGIILFIIWEFDIAVPYINDRAKIHGQHSLSHVDVEKS